MTCERPSLLMQATVCAPEAAGIRGFVESHLPDGAVTLALPTRPVGGGACLSSREQPSMRIRKVRHFTA